MEVTMSTQTMIELFGYLGSFLVLVSFLMVSVVKLRVVNTIGSVIFMIYALIIRSYPTAFMNFCLVLVNIHFLWKMRKEGKEYEYVKGSINDSYLQYLLILYREDILKCFPGTDISYPDADTSFVVSCQGKPVGIALGRQVGSDVELSLDYSIPEYRDFSIGQFLFEELKKEGIQKLIYRGPTEHHMDYLNRMGFTKVEDHYEKVL